MKRDGFIRATDRDIESSNRSLFLRLTSCDVTGPTLESSGVREHPGAREMTYGRLVVAGFAKKVSIYLKILRFLANETLRASNSHRAVHVRDRALRLGKRGICAAELSQIRLLPGWIIDRRVQDASFLEPPDGRSRIAEPNVDHSEIRHRVCFAQRIVKGMCERDLLLNFISRVVEITDIGMHQTEITGGLRETDSVVLRFGSFMRVLEQIDGIFKAALRPRQQSESVVRNEEVFREPQSLLHCERGLSGSAGFDILTLSERRQSQPRVSTRDRARVA